MCTSRLSFASPCTSSGTANSAPTQGQGVPWSCQSLSLQLHRLSPVVPLPHSALNPRLSGAGSEPVRLMHSPATASRELVLWRPFCLHLCLFPFQAEGKESLKHPLWYSQRTFLLPGPAAGLLLEWLPFLCMFSSMFMDSNALYFRIRKMAGVIAFIGIIPYPAPYHTLVTCMIFWKSRTAKRRGRR